eukprot:gene16769-19941_t
MSPSKLSVRDKITKAEEQIVQQSPSLASQGYYGGSIGRAGLIQQTPYYGGSIGRAGFQTISGGKSSSQQVIPSMTSGSLRVPAVKPPAKPSLQSLFKPPHSTNPPPPPST